MRLIPALARVVFWAAAIALIIMLAAGFGTRLGAWSYEFGLGTVLPIGMIFGIVALILGFGWFVASRLNGEDHDRRYGLIGLIGAAAILVLPFYNYYRAATAPPLHDISTDTERPPEFKALLTMREGATNPPGYEGDAPLSWEGEIKPAREVQKTVYGDVRSIAILTSPENLFTRAQHAAEGMGWSIVAVVPDEGRIEATDTSFFFGFTDDIVIRVKPSGMGARLDIRSKSRVGTSDDGANAERIRSFIKRLANS